MNRRLLKPWALVMALLMAGTGCHPQQPFFLHEDGDLSHYLDVATQIEHPDVEHCPLDEVRSALPPLTIENMDSYEKWFVSLEEVMRHALANSQVFRSIGGRVVGNSQFSAPETLSRSIVQRGGDVTVYDPAIVESGNGVNSGSRLNGVGVEAALAEFDARMTGSLNFEKNDRPQNTTTTDTLGVFNQDLMRFNLGVTKQTASGGSFTFQNNTGYDANNTGAGLRPLGSEWTTDFQASFNQPLLQGAGAQYNRIAGPFAFNQFDAGFGNSPDGVVIARIRHDTSLADFEGQLLEFMADVEFGYLDLYVAYRTLEVRKRGRDAALQSWKKEDAKLAGAGAPGGEASNVAQARAQYFLFRSEVETALNTLLSAEARLRYLMGLSTSDGRLICPKDEPTTARVDFDWASAHCESIARRVEIRKKKWEVKRRELELIASKNHLLPRLDMVGNYRWDGLGDDLLRSDRTDTGPTDPGSNAFQTLTGGDFQSWQLGLNLSVPIGFRFALSGVRHQQLLLARERALLDDLELEISHQLGEAVRTLVGQYTLTETNYNRKVSAEAEVEIMTEKYQRGRIPLDLLLDAQRRQADAQLAYYSSLVEYNQAIVDVHLRKGSLLDYNNVRLAEGPWPAKAYFDALREARRRDASVYLDYGFTRPGEFSQGRVPQAGDHGCADCGGNGYDGAYGDQYGGDPYQDGGYPSAPPAEEIPTPQADPQEIPLPESGPPLPEVVPDRSTRRTIEGPALRAAGNARQPGKSKSVARAGWLTSDAPRSAASATRARSKAAFPGSGLRR